MIQVEMGDVDLRGRSLAGPGSFTGHTVSGAGPR